MDKTVRQILFSPFKLFDTDDVTSTGHRRNRIAALAIEFNTNCSHWLSKLLQCICK